MMTPLCVYHLRREKARSLTNQFSIVKKGLPGQRLENPPNPLELPQKVNGGVTSVSVVPTGLWVLGASIPSDDGVS
jgi:hypothetical protein